MAIVDADIVVYGSGSGLPDDDTPTQIGGAINTAIEVVFTDIDPAGTVEALSDGADTRNLTITYLDAAGVQGSEVQALNGTGVVSFSASMAVILKAVLASGSASRTVTIRKSSAGATLITLKVNRTEVRRIFYNCRANPDGGATKTYYEKVFVKNENGASDGTSAQVVEQADPSGNVTFALETTLDGTGDNGVGNNRQVAPTSGIGSFDSATKNVANSGVFTHAKAQGLWLKLTLAGGTVPAETSWTLRLSLVSA